MTSRYDRPESNRTDDRSEANDADDRLEAGDTDGRSDADSADDRSVSDGSLLSDPRPDDGSETVQLLVVNDGDRTVLADLLAQRYRVITDRSVRDADLHLVEDRAFPDYHDELRDRMEQRHPELTPIVVVRRPESARRLTLPDLGDRDGPPLVDDVVDAPIDRTLLFRRLDSLLVRQRQSRELASQLSELQARERELRGFKRAVEQSGHGILITDSERMIRYANPAFEEMTGYDRAAVIGNDPAMLQSGEHDLEFYRDLWETTRSGEVWKNEVINERADGERHVVDQTIAPIGDDEIEGFVSVSSDITDRIRREREVERQKRELDLLRQILTRVLRHNIRNDLTVIAGYAERIADELDDPYATMGETIVETAGKIEAASENARTIGDIVGQPGNLVVHELSVIVENTVGEVRSQYPDVTIETDVSEPCRVLASERLAYAVANLVENAAQHNDAAEPWVCVRTDPGTEGRLIVEDNGPGIPQSEIDPLDCAEETPLEHASSTDLWLIKWIVERSGGSLTFDVTETGTRVELELPDPDTDSATIDSIWSSDDDPL